MNPDLIDFEVRQMLAFITNHNERMQLRLTRTWTRVYGEDAAAMLMELAHNRIKLREALRVI